MKLIGIGGTDGSGKDSLGMILQQSFGWKFISVTDSLREELKKRNLPVTRTNQRMVSSEWRAEHGLAVLIDKAIETFRPIESQYKGLVLASLRNPGEADRIHELGGTVVWVDADPQVRYERITKRNRGGVEDRVTFEEFQAEEQAQMHHSGDETTLSLSGVKERADIFITNDSNDLKAFEQLAQKALGSILTG
jgi:dephospho-CoA kinase